MPTETHSPDLLLPPRVSERLGSLLAAGGQPLLRRQRRDAARRAPAMGRLAALLVDLAAGDAYQPLLAVPHRVRLQTAFVVALASELRWIEGRSIEVAVDRSPLGWLSPTRYAACLPQGCVVRLLDGPARPGDYFRFGLCTWGAAARLSGAAPASTPVVALETDRWSAEAFRWGAANLAARVRIGMTS